MFEGESVFESKSGESAQNPNTCVFWDVDDFPIPNRPDPVSIYKNIKSALANNGYDGNLEIRLYGGTKTLSDQLMLDAGLTFVLKVSARVMVYDMADWVMDNPKSNLLVISQDVTEDPMLLDTVDCLDSRGCNVLLAQSHELHSKLQSQPELLPITIPQLWILTSLLDGGTPIITGWGDNLSEESDDETMSVESDNETMSVESDVETMSGESHKVTGFTTVFWDFVDIPIPMGLSPFIVNKHVELALVNLGYHADWVTFWLYSHKQELSDDMVKHFKIACMTFRPKVPEGKLARVRRMLLDIHLWALDNPLSESKPVGNVMVVSRSLSVEPEFVQRLEALKSRGYRILVVKPKELTLGGTLSTETLDWLWTTMFIKPIHEKESGDVTETVVPESKTDPTTQEITDATKDEKVYTLIPSSSACAECGNLETKSRKSYLNCRRIGVFWDLVDYPIPEDVGFCEATENITSALVAAKEGYEGSFSFLFYYDDEEQPLSDEERKRYAKAQKMFFFPKGGNKLSRVEKMLLDILLWGMDFRKFDPENGIDVMLVSKNISVTGPAFNYVLEGLRSRHYNVLLIHPDGETPMPSTSTLSPEWLWKSLLGNRNSTTCCLCGSVIENVCLLDGEAPIIGQRGHKPRGGGDTVADSED